MVSLRVSWANAANVGHLGVQVQVGPMLDHNETFENSKIGQTTRFWSASILSGSPGQVD